MMRTRLEKSSPLVCAGDETLNSYNYLAKEITERVRQLFSMSVSEDCCMDG